MTILPSKEGAHIQHLEGKSTGSRAHNWPPAPGLVQLTTLSPGTFYHPLSCQGVLALTCGT